MTQFVCWYLELIPTHAFPTRVLGAVICPDRRSRALTQLPGGWPLLGGPYDQARYDQGTTDQDRAGTADAHAHGGAGLVIFAGGDGEKEAEKEYDHCPDQGTEQAA